MKDINMGLCMGVNVLAIKTHYPQLSAAELIFISYNKVFCRGIIA